MRRIESRVQPRSAEFRRFRARNLERVAELRERQQDARFARPERDLERVRRQGKLFVRERIEKLLDPGTPFLELSTLAACTEYGGEARSASVVVGIASSPGARCWCAPTTPRSRAGPGTRSR